MNKANEVKTLRIWYDAQRARQNLLQEQLRDKVESLLQMAENQENLIKARWVFTEVAKQTQSHFKEYVESLVTMAVQSAWPDRDLKFILEFEVSNNRTVAQLKVQEGDNPPYNPENDMGGSILDIVGVALRIVLWSLENPKSRSLIIADEPLKFAGKGAVLLQAGQILREISHKMGFQLILITHEPMLAQIADKAWTVGHNKVHSVVTLLKEEEVQQEVVIPKRRRTLL